MDLMSFSLSLGRHKTWLAFYMANLKLFMHLFIDSIYIYCTLSVPDTELLNQALGIIKPAKHSVHMILHGMKELVSAMYVKALADTSQIVGFATKWNSELSGRNLADRVSLVFQHSLGFL